MIITQISYFDIQGGAARAAYRLYKGLLSIGENAAMVVRNKKSDDQGVVPVNIMNPLQKSEQNLADFIQQEYINKNRTALSDTFFAYPYPGIDLSSLDMIRNADIINLHWVSSFQSIETIAKLLAIGKPVVWTLHDENPFTGGCHYTAGCNGFMKDCKNCPQLKDDPYNLPYHVLSAKQKLWKGNLTIVTPSEWLARRAKQSRLFKNFNVKAIPNSLETDTFAPTPKNIAKNKFGISSDSVAILFGTENHAAKRKGFDEFIKAIEHCKKNEQFQKLIKQSKIEILTYGNQAQEIINLDIPIHSLGYINDDDKMALAYSAADMFVLPSLEDNLPNTMLEAMSCGTPVIAFDIGGMPDVIASGKDGILVPAFDTKEFGDAIIKVALNKSLRDDMSQLSRVKIVNGYGLEVQANNYLSLFKDLVPRKSEPISVTNQNTACVKTIETDQWSGGSIDALYPLSREYSLKTINELADQLRVSEADRAARLEQINRLTVRLKESEIDRGARLEQINKLTAKLKESEADRAARLEQIIELTRLLKESEADRAARLEQIFELTKLLKESEADRMSQLEVIRDLERQRHQLEEG